MEDSDMVGEAVRPKAPLCQDSNVPKQPTQSSLGTVLKSNST